MNNVARALALAVTAALLAACSSPQICTRPVAQSDPRATKLVAASRTAHGAKAFARIADLSVRYEGKWGAIGPRFQPVLADREFRRDSEERWIANGRLLAQAHTGPAGKKDVLRTPQSISVAYNGVGSSEPEVRDAAALVADAYQLFLLGPFYFDRPGVKFVPGGEGSVDGAPCDQVLAVLTPGFGNAPEDRVILSIDRDTKLLRRVRMTLNGLESTRGAEVDVTFRKHRNVRGLVLPTEFNERIREPFDLQAHFWRLRGVDFNRGLKRADFTRGGWSQRAAAPAAPIPDENS
jgi:hypothetical protein